MRIDPRRLAAFTDTARQEVEASLVGRPMNRHHRRLYQELAKLADAVEFSETMETALAMFLLWEREPRAFASDRGFRFQLVRRLRGLTDLNAGTWFDAETEKEKAKRAYRELPPKAADLMAVELLEFFARAAGHVIRLEREDTAKNREGAEELDLAFEGGGA